MKAINVQLLREMLNSEKKKRKAKGSPENIFWEKIHGTDIKEGVNIDDAILVYKMLFPMRIKRVKVDTSPLTCPEIETALKTPISGKLLNKYRQLDRDLKAIKSK